jgi:hypothetical protein
MSAPDQALKMPPPEKQCFPMNKMDSGGDKVDQQVL